MKNQKNKSSFYNSYPMICKTVKIKGEIITTVVHNTPLNKGDVLSFECSIYMSDGKDYQAGYVSEILETRLPRDKNHKPDSRFYKCLMSIEMP